MALQGLQRTRGGSSCLHTILMAKRRVAEDRIRIRLRKREGEEIKEDVKKWARS